MSNTFEEIEWQNKEHLVQSLRELNDGLMSAIERQQHELADLWEFVDKVAGWKFSTIGDSARILKGRYEK